MNSIIIQNNIIHNTRFDFEYKYSTKHQIYQFFDVIASSVEVNTNPTSIFKRSSSIWSCMTHWYTNLQYKLIFVPIHKYLIIQSFLNNSIFKFYCSDGYFEYQKIQIILQICIILYNILYALTIIIIIWQWYFIR